MRRGVIPGLVLDPYPVQDLVAASHRRPVGSQEECFPGVQPEPAMARAAT